MFVLLLALLAPLDVFPLRLTIHDPGESLDPPFELRIEHVLFFALECARLMTAAGKKRKRGRKEKKSWKSELGKRAGEV